jgi:hypothetical protein
LERRESKDASPLFLQLSGGKMKKLTYFIVIMLLLIGLAACSEDDNPTGEDVLGYKLDQFVDAAAVRNIVDAEAEETDDFRSLFAYEIVSGEDGYSPRESENAGYDLPWNLFSGGYYVPSDNHRTWFPDADLPGAFKVRDTGLFRLYRKVEVNAGLRGTKQVELMGLTTYPTENWAGGSEDAIKLSDLLQGIAVYDSVGFVAADGYTKYYQPELVNDGYYLLNSEVTTFPNFNDSLPGSAKKFKKLASVEIYGATSDMNTDIVLAPQVSANITFTVPADLSGYTSTVMVTE